MSNTATQTNQAPTHPHLVPVARRQRQPFAAAARWLALALLAGFTLAAQAQRTATATATVMSGFVVDITVTDGGAGYYSPPAVTITGGGGSGATATSTVTNGAVNRINVLTTGGGYTSTPAVVIAPPALAIQMAPMLVVDGEPGSTARGKLCGSCHADTKDRHHQCCAGNERLCLGRPGGSPWSAAVSGRLGAAESFAESANGGGHAGYL
jgi:hypothetical protein